MKQIPHNGLVDIQYIDVLLGKVGANFCNNADHIFAEYGDDNLVHALPLLFFVCVQSKRIDVGAAIPRRYGERQFGSLSAPQKEAQFAAHRLVGKFREIVLFAEMPEQHLL